MGLKLTNYYEEAAKQMGVMGRVKLAMLTKLSSEKAAAAEDSPENLRIFETAMAQLRQTPGK